MKYILKILKICLIVIVSIVIVVFIYYAFFYKPYYPGPESEGPIPDLRTKRERRFCDSLLQNGYSHVELRIIAYKDQGNSKIAHWLFYKKANPFSCENVDSINYNNAQLLAQLITFYVEDSTIFQGEFLVNCRDVNDYNKSFTKWEQKSVCGFQVVKIGKNQFKRIYNRPKNSGIKLFIPEQWKHSEFLCLSPD
jgi:hypothetical protein